MEIQHGAEVVDKNGRVLGNVDYVICNTWTGKISRFMVWRKAPEGDLFLSPQDVLDATKSRIMLRVSSEELNEKSKR